MPNFSGPLSASPDNLTITRRYFGFAIEMSRPSSWPILVRIRLTHSQAKPHRPPAAGPDPSGSTTLGPLLWVHYCGSTTLVRGRPFNALAESKPDKAGDPDRPAGLGFGFLHRLGNRLFVVEDEALVQQANLFVVGLQTGLDDLFDDIGGLALRLGLVGEDGLLAGDGGRIEPTRVDGPRIGRGDMHCHHAAEGFQFIVLAGRFERDEHADPAQAVAHGIVHVARYRAFAD